MTKKRIFQENFISSLRRQVRLRKEYLYNKSQEDAKRKVEEKKELVKKALDENLVIPSHLQKEALELQRVIEFDDDGGEGVSSHMDDEYRWAGVEDPRVMITTSRDPSSRLKQFAKEMKLVIPNSQRMNRGKHELPALVQACRANNVSDFILLHEHRGVPGEILYLFKSVAALLNAGAPPQRGEQYSIRLDESFVCGQELRWAEERFCTTEDSQSVTGFGGQFGNVAFPGKVMADCEIQKLELKDFFKRIVEKVDGGGGG
uniref:IMP U3 small nucleolar ribonucleoprotein 4 n=1 Tax=Eptatretus burgeri TaxID=7764 RepID=A0A8C4R4H6_EPTBU